LSPKRLRPANPLVLTSPVATPAVVSTLPPVISSHLLNNNYLLTPQSQAAAAAVANFSHPQAHQIAQFQPQPILPSLQSSAAALSQIKSIISSSSAVIPTQIPNFINNAIVTSPQLQQPVKSINTTSSYIINPTSVASGHISNPVASTSPSNSISPVTLSPSTATPTPNNNNMDQVGQIGQNPMQSHQLSQSMDSVNTASNEEEVSFKLNHYYLSYYFIFF
jgi:hypothetical protein